MGDRAARRQRAGRDKIRSGEYRGEFRNRHQPALLSWKTLAGWQKASGLARARLGSGAPAPPGRSRSQYQFAVSCQAQPVFTAFMFYDHFAATPEESPAGNPLPPRRRRRAHNIALVRLIALGIRLQIHDVMMVILINQVKRELRPD